MQSRGIVDVSHGPLAGPQDVARVGTVYASKSGFGRRNFGFEHDETAWMSVRTGGIDDKERPLVREQVERGGF